jgi:hypothetical protein
MRRIYGLHDGSGEIRYVGMTMGQLGERRRAHRKVARKGDPTRRGAWIRSVLANGGDIVITQLARGDWTQSEAWELEREWIAKLRAEGNDLTNMTSGGGGARDLPIDLRARISASAGDALRGTRRDPAIGAAISRSLKKHYREHPEARDQIAERQRGRVVSDEAKRKMGDARRGRALSQTHRDAIAAGGRGKTLSEETKRKIADARRGVAHTAEHRQKVSEWIEANRQRCVECGKESTASSITRHQTKTGHSGRELLSEQP